MERLEIIDYIHFENQRVKNHMNQPQVWCWRLTYVF